MNLNKKPSECAPCVKSEICSRKYILDAMKEFIVEYNILDKKSKSNNLNNPKKIIKILGKYLNCSSESCILSNPEFIKKIGKKQSDIEKKERFLPFGPHSSTELLNNFHIDDRLFQYKEKYKDYYPFHFQMIDFDKVGSELSYSNIPKLIKHGYRTFSVVFNTDVSTGGGKHWFAVFIDARNIKHKNNNYKGLITIEYFNSSGNMPKNEIHIWMNKVKFQIIKEFGKDINCKIIIVSNIVYQKDYHSCGPYSLYFIISRLRGVSYKKFRNYNIVNDKQMIKFRKFLFREYN